MNIQDLLRKTFTYRYIYLPYRQKQGRERIQKQYEYLIDKAPELVRNIINVFNAEGIPYWLEFGTLLGAYRDKTIIKGDFDLDFGAYQKDVANIYMALSKAGFKLVREFHEIGRNGIEQSYYDGNITFDIFYFSEEDTNSLSCFAFTPIPNRSVPNKTTYGKVSSWTFKKFDLVKYDFLGSEVYIPANTEEHIEEIYGKQWRIPDPNFKQGFNRRNYDITERMGVGFQYM